MLLQYFVSLTIRQAEQDMLPVIAGLLLATFYTVTFADGATSDSPMFDSEDEA